MSTNAQGHDDNGGMAAQLSTGQNAFADKCSSCHGIRFGGGMGPPLTGTVFMDKWAGQSGKDIFDYVADKMPLGLGRSLADEIYLAITVFLLDQNGQAVDKAGPALTTMDLEMLMIK